LERRARTLAQAVSGSVGSQAVSVGASGCSGRMSNGTNETGNGSGGDRSCHRGRFLLRRSTYSPIGPTCRRARPMSGHSQSRFLPARCRHRPPTFSRSQSRPVRRSAPTFSRVLPTSGPVRWPLSTSSRGLSPPPTRCHREPTRRSRLAPPTRRLRPSRTRTCSPPSSEFPICCGPTRRRLPAKPRVRPCRSGRRRWLNEDVQDLAFAVHGTLDVQLSAVETPL